MCGVCEGLCGEEFFKAIRPFDGLKEVVDWCMCDINLVRNANLDINDILSREIVPTWNISQKPEAESREVGVWILESETLR